ncbi:unnamed protein product [Linum tenue]|uniref:Uncharacterized protein n=1 Tax=Linum tenue TaxID=586396 RepID=A0AAV0NYP8_9ROSI|nr:unnamed protein product [Linum tenue]
MICRDGRDLIYGGNPSLAWTPRQGFQEASHQEGHCVARVRRFNNRFRSGKSRESPATIEVVDNSHDDSEFNSPDQAEIPEKHNDKQTESQ